jgi:hypothetical protein
VNEIGSIFEARALDALRTVGRVLSEQGVDLPLFLRVVDFETSSLRTGNTGLRSATMSPSVDEP